MYVCMHTSIIIRLDPREMAGCRTGRAESCADLACSNPRPCFSEPFEPNTHANTALHSRPPLARPPFGSPRPRADVTTKKGRSGPTCTQRLLLLCLLFAVIY